MVVVGGIDVFPCHGGVFARRIGADEVTIVLFLARLFGFAKCGFFECESGLTAKVGVGLLVELEKVGEGGNRVGVEGKRECALADGVVVRAEGSESQSPFFHFFLVLLHVEILLGQPKMTISTVGRKSGRGSVRFDEGGIVERDSVVRMF